MDKPQEITLHIKHGKSMGVVGCGCLCVFAFFINSLWISIAMEAIFKKEKWALSGLVGIGFFAIFGLLMLWIVAQHAVLLRWPWSEIILTPTEFRVRRIAPPPFGYDATIALERILRADIHLVPQNKGAKSLPSRIWQYRLTISYQYTIAHLGYTGIWDSNDHYWGGNLGETMSYFQNSEIGDKIVILVDSKNISKSLLLPKMGSGE
jgi:hypothetical protein